MNLCVTINRRHFLLQVQYWLGSVALLTMGCGGGKGDRSPFAQLQAPITLKLESSAFSSNGMIPAQYTCDGADISPALHWDNPPAGTRSLALVVDDPDAPLRTFTHWLLYDLPAETRQLPEGLPQQPLLPDGGTQGKSDFGRHGYGGPCPPGGTHRYFFRLFALDTRLDLPSEATKQELITAMEDHILATGELVGRYSRQ